MNGTLLDRARARVRFDARNNHVNRILDVLNHDLLFGALTALFNFLGGDQVRLLRFVVPIEGGGEAAAECLSLFALVSKLWSILNSFEHMIRILIRKTHQWRFETARLTCATTSDI